MSRPEPENTASIKAFLWAIWKHWITLAGGCALIVLVGIFEKVSGKNIPLSAYLGLLALLFCTACYLAWRDAQKKLVSLSGNAAFKRDFLADRLRTLLRDAEEAMKINDTTLFSGFTSGFLPARNHNQIHTFLKTYYDEETVKRFHKNGLVVVEELLAECYRDGSLTVTQKVVDTED